MSETGSNSLAAGRLRSFVERVERLEAEIKELNADKSDVYKVARGEGYDVKTMRKVVSARKLETTEREEADALFDAYMAALGMLPQEQPSRVHVHVREAEMHQRPSNNDEPSPEAGPQAEASLVGTDTGTPADREGRLDGEVGVASLPTDFEPPAFLARGAKPLRPHCQRPDNCGGYGAKHCYSCLNEHFPGVEMVSA